MKGKLFRLRSATAVKLPRPNVRLREAREAHLDRIEPISVCGREVKDVRWPGVAQGLLTPCDRFEDAVLGVDNEVASDADGLGDRMYGYF